MKVHRGFVFIELVIAVARSWLGGVFCPLGVFCFSASTSWLRDFVKVRMLWGGEND
jgi:hypothetical protein